MSYALYQYPEKALVNRPIPKTKFYEKANITKTVKDAFISQIQNIVWAYKLSPETINLNATRDLLEIEVFRINLKTSDLNEKVLSTIDKAIPHPILFEIYFEDKVQVKFAYKRINETGSDKWIVDQYFLSPWLTNEEADVSKTFLPVALNLNNLYEQILKDLISTKAKPLENIKKQTERHALAIQKEKEIKQIEIKIRNEKQFKNKAELNSKLKALKKQLNELIN